MQLEMFPRSTCVSCEADILHKMEIRYCSTRCASHDLAILREARAPDRHLVARFHLMIDELAEYERGK